MTLKQRLLISDLPTALVDIEPGLWFYSKQDRVLFPKVPYFSPNPVSVCCSPVLQTQTAQPGSRRGLHTLWEKEHFGVHNFAGIVSMKGYTMLIHEVSKYIHSHSILLDVSDALNPPDLRIMIHCLGKLADLSDHRLVHHLQLRAHKQTLPDSNRNWPTWKWYENEKWCMLSCMHIFRTFMHFTAWVKTQTCQDITKVMRKHPLHTVVIWAKSHGNPSKQKCSNMRMTWEWIMMWNEMAIQCGYQTACDHFSVFVWTSRQPASCRVWLLRTAEGALSESPLRCYRHHSMCEAKRVFHDNVIIEFSVRTDVVMYDCMLHFERSVAAILTNREMHCAEAIVLYSSSF